MFVAASAAVYSEKVTFVCGNNKKQQTEQTSIRLREIEGRVQLCYLYSSTELFSNSRKRSRSARTDDTEECPIIDDVLI